MSCEWNFRSLNHKWAERNRSNSAEGHASEMNLSAAAGSNHVNKRLFHACTIESQLKNGCFLERFLIFLMDKSLTEYNTSHSLVIRFSGAADGERNM